MLKKIINSAHIKFEIIPVDPLLIKSGQATVGGTDMSFVRTYKSGEKEEPFIPGSSIKGMIRAYAEKICRTLGDNKIPVCLPYVDRGTKNNKWDTNEIQQEACGLRIKPKDKDNEIDIKVSSAKMYNISCPVCRLFGSHNYSGRLATSDAYLKEGSRHLFEIRDGIAIDRLTGGTAGGAKFDFEVLTKGDFVTSLDIRNFERWQLGLVGLVLRDMEDGLIRLGFGKSRGLGRIKAVIKEFKIISYNKELNNLSGIAQYCTKDEKELYGFFDENGAEDGGGWPGYTKKGLRYEYTITELWKDVLKPAVNDLVKFIKVDNWPEKIDDFVTKGN